MRTRFLAALLLLAPAAGANTLYKCTDGGGSILYTNQKASDRRCVVLSHQPSASLPGITGMGGTSGGSRTRASSTPTPGDFPRVTGDEQRARDGDRRAILDKELLAEEQNLGAARRKLQEQGGQSGAKDEVALHERNVMALKKEIANLR
jgi:hypothetical protein